ncbi:MAG TPA: hemolysin family protein [Solirubrobacteraceae bacterium]|nr:hemolysin family protein [Solirubrobacteraceae bacterium]
MSDGLRILAVLALVAGNAFFVIGEYSVITARRAALAGRSGAGARAALRLMDDPVRVISTTQVGITAIAILTGAVGEPLVRDLLGDGIPTWLSFAIAFAVVTYLSVVVGELVPKALTLQRAETLAILIAPAIELLEKLLKPIVWVLERSAGLLLRPLGIREVTAGAGIRTADELRALVDEAEGSGVIGRAQEQLLHNVFDFGSREARDIMVPALDVEWIDADTLPRDAVTRFIDAPHRRYPVGRGDLDHLVGEVHTRDVVAAERDRPDVPVGELARPAVVVPETKHLGPLLRELREARRRMAVVVDEYGAVAGIVTLEDVLEEIVGDLDDEFDRPEVAIERHDDSHVTAAGSLNLDEVDEALGTHLPRRGPRTLGGLAFDALGRRPELGAEADVDGVRMRVADLDGHRITKVHLTLPEE